MWQTLTVENRIVPVRRIVRHILRKFGFERNINWIVPSHAETMLMAMCQLMVCRRTFLRILCAGWSGKSWFCGDAPSTHFGILCWKSPTWVGVLSAGIVPVGQFAFVLKCFPFSMLVPRRLLPTILLVGSLLALYMVPGQHRPFLIQMEKKFLWCLYWVGLGVLSSVGLGTGLHTFLLYLVSPEMCMGFQPIIKFRVRTLPV